MTADAVFLDFETEKIQKRPVYPPVPVGLAIKERGREPEYLSWGHPSNNNCTKAQAVRRLKGYYRNSRLKKVFHNAGFDMEVGVDHMELRMLNEHEFEDTMFLAFLFNPRMRSIGLKESSELLLDMPPDEQTELKEWVLANVRTEEGKKIAPSKWGEYICMAPGDMAGKYAKGDVVRTEALYDFLLPEIIHWGMDDAYLTERLVLPITIEMEQTGIMLDTNLLEQDIEKYENQYVKLERAIKRKLGDINLNAGQQIADAMERLDIVSDQGWEYTEKGNRKTGRDALVLACTDKKLVDQLGMHSKMSKILTTYMRPWFESAIENNGLFYPWFNQVRSDDGYGTKTGRFSSNFQQVPKRPDDVRLPYMRNYVIGDKKSHILIVRDFSQQEYRILADYEEGALYQAYLENPFTDVHEKVRQLIYELLHVLYDRSPVKIINFGKVYGSGIKSTAERMNASYEETKMLIDAYDKALPGVKALMKEITKHSKKGLPIRTAGGRVYYPERGWEYRMMNTLIQSSAADHTKRSMVRIYDAFKHLDNETRIMLTVHDEFLNSTPKRGYRSTMKICREAMEDDDLFDIPMLSDGKYGRSWGSCIPFDDRR